jgi:O-antigen ligase
MFAERPIFGFGMDNFRLLHGKFSGLKDWDKTIRANSLYLELLVGGGLAGLLSFMAMMGAVRWKLDAASVALAIFLVHGLVDDFLMTTPIYFAFWFLMGQAGRDAISPRQELP